jgi:hypothetical protein
LSFSRHSELRTDQIRVLVCPAVSGNVNHAVLLELLRRLAARKENSDNNSSSPLLQLHFFCHRSDLPSALCLRHPQNLHSGSVDDRSGCIGAFTVRICCQSSRHRTQIRFDSLRDFKLLCECSRNRITYFDWLHRHDIGEEL